MAVFAFSAGAAIALQAGMNAKLGVLLKSSLLGTGVAFFCACSFTFIVAGLSVREYPATEDLRSVPHYLWFGGGALSAFGVGIFYYLIPRMGVGPMMSYALVGQIVMAMLASHFGWFDQPERLLDVRALFGVLCLVCGIFLINWESVNVR